MRQFPPGGHTIPRREDRRRTRAGSRRARQSTIGQPATARPDLRAAVGLARRRCCRRCATCGRHSPTEPGSSACACLAGRLPCICPNAGRFRNFRATRWPASRRSALTPDRGCAVWIRRPGNARRTYPLLARLRGMRLFPPNQESSDRNASTHLRTAPTSAGNDGFGDHVGFSCARIAVRSKHDEPHLAVRSCRVLRYGDEHAVLPVDHHGSRAEQLVRRH